MGFKLLPGKVYATNPTHTGITIFQIVGGDVQLFGTNITKYSNKNGDKRILVPEFEDLIVIWDDVMQMDTVNPMSCLTTWIGYKAVDPLDPVEVWVNAGINERITPTFDVRLGQGSDPVDIPENP